MTKTHWQQRPLGCISEGMIELHGLNRTILSLAPSHIARQVVPMSFPQLVLACDLSALPVWDGASDRTVFGDARVNHAFRAWHDSHHIRLGADFTLAGETRVCEAQIAELHRLWPRHPLVWDRLIRVEVIGQVTYAVTHGHFPIDQIQFTRKELGL